MFGRLFLITPTPENGSGNAAILVHCLGSSQSHLRNGNGLIASISLPLFASICQIHAFSDPCGGNIFVSCVYMKVTPTNTTRLITSLFRVFVPPPIGNCCSKDGVEFEAHRFVLASQAPTFFDALLAQMLYQYCLDIFIRNDCLCQRNVHFDGRVPRRTTVNESLEARHRGRVSTYPLVLYWGDMLRRSRPYGMFKTLRRTQQAQLAPDCWLISHSSKNYGVPLKSVV